MSHSHLNSSNLGSSHFPSRRSGEATSQDDHIDPSNLIWGQQIGEVEDGRGGSKLGFKDVQYVLSSSYEGIQPLTSVTLAELVRFQQDY